MVALLPLPRQGPNHLEKPRLFKKKKKKSLYQKRAESLSIEMIL